MMSELDYEQEEANAYLREKYPNHPNFTKPDKFGANELDRLEHIAREHLAKSMYSESEKEEMLIPIMADFTLEQVAALRAQNEELKKAARKVMELIDNHQAYDKRV